MLGTIMRLRGGKKRPAVTSDVEGCIFASDVVAMCVLRACVCVCVCVCVFWEINSAIRHVFQHLFSLVINC
jgi:hypothetical protein